MKIAALRATSRLFIVLCLAVLLLSGCGGASSAPATTWILNVTSSSISRSTGIVGGSPAVNIAVTPADIGHEAAGKVEFYRTYNNDANVTLTAPQNFNGFTFSGWSGCNQAASGVTCKLIMSSNQTVTANFTTP